MRDFDSPRPEESAFHGGMPLVQTRPATQALFPYFLVVFGTLLVVAVGAYWWMNSTMKAERDARRLEFVKAELESEHEIETAAIRREMELEKEKIRRDAEALLEGERLARQRAAHAELLHLVTRAQGQLELLLASQREHDDLLAGGGREIAARDELLTRFEILEREHPAPVFDPASVRDFLRTVADRSAALSAESGAAAGPSQELKQAVDTAIAEVNAALKSQEATNQALRALVSEALGDGVPAADVELEVALETRAQRAEQARQAALAEAEEGGRREAERQIEALVPEQAGEITRIKVDAAHRDFHQQQESIRRLYDALYEAQQAKDDEQIRIVAAELDKEIAELRSKAGLAEAEVKIVEAAAEAKQSEKELEAARIAAETERKRLIEKAKTAEVAAALAPFVGKGYWQPGRAKPGLDPGGMSLAAIKASGGLDRTSSGLRKLFNLGADPRNDRDGGWSPKDRMQGRPLEGWLKNKPEARDAARRAQDLLVELARFPHE